MAEQVKLTGNEDISGLKWTKRTLPSHAYYDPDVFRREMQEIWFKEWVYLCRSDALDGPRTYRTFEIADQGILLLRDGDGALQAFHNTCPHRGSQLKTDKGGKFNSNLIVCPYHQWSFSMQGDLVRTTSLSEAVDFCKEDHPLYRIALHEWRGCVFISLAESPVPFEEAQGNSLDTFNNWPVEDLLVAETWTHVMDCNWKTFWDNYMECLHCPDIHPELCDIMPRTKRRMTSMKDDPNWKEHENSTDPYYSRGLKPGAETWSYNGKAATYQFENLTEEERFEGVHFMTLLPTIYMAGHVDYMRIVRLTPLGPEKTEIQAEWLIPQQTVDDSNFDRQNTFGFARLVMEQDVVASEMNQRGMHSIRHDTGVFMPEEVWLHGFAEWYRERMGNGET